MARVGVSYPQIAQIAHEILASGHQPTVERIRAQLKTGSHSTINKHLREWRLNQEQQAKFAHDKIPEELVAILKGLWDKMVAQAHEKVDVITQRYEEELSDHQQALKQLRSEKQQLIQDANQLQLEYANLMQQTEQLNQALTKARAEYVFLQTKEEGNLKQLEEKQIHIQSLKDQNKQIQANLEHYSSSVIEQRHQDRLQAEKHQHELNLTIHQLKQENDILKQQFASCQNLNEQLAIKQDAIGSQLALKSLDIERLENTIQETQKTLIQQSASQQLCQSQFQDLSGQYAQKLQAINNLNTDNAVLAEKNNNLQNLLSETLEQNKSLVHDKWILGQEKAQLQGQLLQLQCETKAGC